MALFGKKEFFGLQQNAGPRWRALGALADV
jgi:hypothetical protein